MSVEIPLKDYEAALFAKSKWQGQGILQRKKKIINVVRDYKWHTGLATDIPQSHIPRLLLREFEIANNSTWGGLKRSAIMLIRENPYASMYVCEKTGLKLVLPYFNEAVWSSKITWEAVDMGGENNSGSEKSLFRKMAGGIVGFAHKLVGQLEQLSQDLNPFDNSNAIVLNTPMAWKEGTADGLATKFYLINTNAGKASWYENFKLCQYLKAICLHDQQNTTKSSQPPIFEAFIPGYRYLPAAAITSVQIKQIGSVIPYHAIGRHDNGNDPVFVEGKYGIEQNDFYVPDAWEVEIQITPLVMASRQTEIFGLNPTRIKVAAITDTVGSALDTQPYSPTDELGIEGEENETAYQVKNERNIFDLENGTQQGVTENVTDG